MRPGRASAASTGAAEASWFANHMQSRLLAPVPPQERLKLSRYLGHRAWKKREEFYRSGELVDVEFYAPDLPERKALLASINATAAHQFIEARSSHADSITVRCFPENVEYVRDRFCYITNCVPRFALNSLSRSPLFPDEDIGCLLPGGGVVDLATLQKWLIESTAAGWKVGISRVRGKGSLEEPLVAKRQMSHVDSRPTAASNVGPARDLWP